MRISDCGFEEVLALSIHNPKSVFRNSMVQGEKFRTSLRTNLPMFSVILPTLLKRAPLLALVCSESRALFSPARAPVAVIAVGRTLRAQASIKNSPLDTLMTRQDMAQPVALMTASAHLLPVVSCTPPAVG
jgi:hypothetical protein